MDKWIPWIAKVSWVPLGAALLIGLTLAGCRPAAPRIVVEPAVKNLGERPQEPLALTYTVRNEGTAPLIIEKVSTSCGCTKAWVDREKISPGESATLQVTLDPTEDDLYGDLLRVIYLRSNDPQNPEVQVEFRVLIRKPEGG